MGKLKLKCNYYSGTCSKNGNGHHYCKHEMGHSGGHNCQTCGASI